MIEKSTIIITSTGRTGTDFFANLFAKVIPDCTSLHEPDIIKYSGVENRYHYLRQQIRRTGIWRMVILKALGKWTLVKISDERFQGVLEDRLAEKRLYDQRKGFIAKMPGKVYVEANLGYYGLLDIAPGVFKNHRAIYLVRDGRDWVRSMWNWGEVYGKTGIRKLIGHRWPTAEDLPTDEYAEKWHAISRFEQLCWAWTRLNEFALRSIAKNPRACLFHFETIFTGNARYEQLADLVHFATDGLPDLDPGTIGSTQGWLEQKIHQSSGGFPGWENWTADQKRSFEHLCGPLMEKLGYKF